MILSKKKNHISTTENIMKTQKLTLSWSYKHRTLHNEKHDSPIATIFIRQFYAVVTLTSSSRQQISFSNNLKCCEVTKRRLKHLLLKPARSYYNCMQYPNLKSVYFPQNLNNNIFLQIYTDSHKNIIIKI